MAFFERPGGGQNFTDPENSLPQLPFDRRANFFSADVFDELEASKTSHRLACGEPQEIGWLLKTRVFFKHAWVVVDPRETTTMEGPFAPLIGASIARRPCSSVSCEPRSVSRGSTVSWSSGSHKLLVALLARCLLLPR